MARRDSNAMSVNIDQTEKIMLHDIHNQFMKGNDISAANEIVRQPIEVL